MSNFSLARAQVEDLLRLTVERNAFTSSEVQDMLLDVYSCLDLETAMRMPGTEPILAEAPDSEIEEFPDHQMTAEAS